MRIHLFTFGLSWILGLGISGAANQAGAAIPFAIAATNVTMPAHGNGVTHYTVSGIPMTGYLLVNCQYSGPGTTARIPNCTAGPIVDLPVDAGQTVSGAVQFYPYGAIVPLAERGGEQAAVGLALAGFLLIGLRRRVRRGLRLTAVVFIALAGMTVFTSCGNGWNGMAPGTYQYTLTAGNGSGLNNAVLGTNTTIYVTVP